MNSKERMAQLDDIWAALNDDEAAVTAVKIAWLESRLKEAKEAFRVDWKRGHDDNDTKDVYVDGEKVATITVGRDGVGEYKVTDPVAYGNVLHDIQAKVPGGKNAWERVNHPRKEAASDKYLRQLIADHQGEIPDGVEYKPGRRGGVTIRLEQSIKDRPLTVDSTRTVVGLLTKGETDEQ